MKKGYWGVTIMKKKLVSIVITALMLSLTACGNSSKEATESVTQESIETEVSVQNENEVQDVKEPTETSQDEDKKVSEESTKDSKSETVSKDEVETTSKEEATDKNKDSDKPEASAEPTPEPTKEPVESTPAPVQSQTFNVNIDNYGDFVLTVDDNVQVTSEIRGWSTDLGDGSYKLNLYIPLAAQDTGKTFNFAIKCPDNVKNSTMTNYDTGYEMPFTLTFNNDFISGTSDIQREGENNIAWIQWILIPN